MCCVSVHQNTRRRNSTKWPALTMSVPPQVGRASVLRGGHIEQPFVFLVDCQLQTRESEWRFFFFYKNHFRESVRILEEMNQGWQSGSLSKVTTKFGDLSPMPETFVVEGEKWLSQSSSELHRSTLVHTQIPTQKKSCKTFKIKNQWGSENISTAGEDFVSCTGSHFNFFFIFLPLSRQGIAL